MCSTRALSIARRCEFSSRCSRLKAVALSSAVSASLSPAENRRLRIENIEVIEAKNIAIDANIFKYSLVRVDDMSFKQLCCSNLIRGG